MRLQILIFLFASETLVSGQFLFFTPLDITNWFYSFVYEPVSRILDPRRQSPLEHYTVHGAAAALYAKAKPVYQHLTSRPWQDLVYLPKETWMNTDQLIENEGFKSETYEVTTKDGYILTLYRVVKKEKALQKNKGTPVLLLNVLFCCNSRVWVMNLRNQSLGFVLADAGYDVWLGNFRAAVKPRKHTTFKPNSKDYWSFTLDEFAKYDLLSQIDYVIQSTSYEKIFMIGCGFSYFPALMGLSDYPEYNDKLLGLVSLSSGTRMFDTKMSTFTKGFAKLALPITNYIANNVVVALLPDKIFNLTIPYAANFFAPIFIEMTTTVVEGLRPSSTSLNLTRMPVYFGNFPLAVSYRLNDHGAQCLARGNLVHYDWGNKKENIRRHGKATPEVYDVSKVTTHVLVVYVQKDILSAREEAVMQQKMLKRTTLYEVPDATWPHWAYYLNINGKPVFDRIVQFFQEKENEFGDSYKPKK